MVVLGIDPGTLATGWAVLEKVDSKLLLQGFGQICLVEQSISQRLASLYQAVTERIKTYSPHVMVIEKIFVSRSPASALVLGYARGIAMMTAALQAIPVIEYAPTTVKKALTGYGHASKEQMVAMVAHLFQVSMPHDAADAVALALYHCQQNLYEKVRDHF